MASKYSPESQGSPLLAATIAAAGMLLLIEAIQYHLPKLIASLQQGAHTAFAVAVVLVVIFVLTDGRVTPSSGPTDPEFKNEGHHGH